MDAFVSMVRKGEVPTPTKRTFKVEVWTKTFETLTAPSQADHRLFSQGLWFHKKFELIRKKLSKAKKYEMSMEDMIKIYCSLSNRDYSLLYMQVADKILGDKDSIICVEEAISQRVKINSSIIKLQNEKEYNHDGLVAGIVESLKYPLSEALQFRSRKLSEVDDSKAISIGIYIRTLGMSYVILESLWWQYLWNDWQFFAGENADFTSPPLSKKERLRIASHYRRYSLGLQTLMLTVEGWSKYLPEKVREAITKDIKGVEVLGSIEKIRFQVSASPGANEPPLSHLQSVLISEMYFASILDFKLPRVDDLPLKILIEAWALLVSIGEQLRSKLIQQDDAATSLEELYRFCPLLSINKLKTIFEKVLRISNKQAESIIKVFSYSNGKDDLWSKPLVKLNETTVIPLVAVITSAYLLRLAESWMKVGGIDLGERGPLFEKEVRTRIAAAISRSRVLKDVGVHPSNLNFNGEQYDLVLRIGRTVVVGEVKCIISPAEPIEFYNYYQTLVGAARQAKRKCEVAKGNPTNFLEQLGLTATGDVDYSFIPIILVNYPIYAGHSIDEIPVVDLRIVESYLSSAQLDRYVYTDHKEVTTVGEVVSFYDSSEEAAANFEGYLKNPPQLEVFEQNVKLSENSFIPSMGENDKPTFIIEYDMNLSRADGKFLIPDA